MRQNIAETYNTFGIGNTYIIVDGKPDRYFENLGTGRRII
jgi:hypothetical protein